VISPPIAGWLVDAYGWPFVFYLNLPVALAVLAGGLFVIPDSDREAKPLDWFGFATLIGGVAVLQLALSRGERLDWFESTEIVLTGLGAGVLLYLFAAHTATARRPFFDRALFTDRNFMLGQACIFLVGAIIYLPMILLPLLLQQIAGYSAQATGELLFARGAGTIVSLIVLSQVRDKVDPRPLFLLGLVAIAIPTWQMSQWTTDVRAVDVIAANFIQGLATGAIWAPLNALALKHLDKRIQDQGFAMFYLNFDIGNAIGVAAIFSLHARHSQTNQAILGEQVTLFNPLLRYGALPDHWSLSEAEGLAALNEEVARQAVMIAYNNSFLLSAILTVAIIPMVFLFMRKR